MNEQPQIKVAIVDDHTLFRNGVSGLLKEFPELLVLFEAENGQQLQQQVGRHGLPDIVLMDINMPIMDGYAATTWLKRYHPSTHVLALSMYEDDQAVIGMIRQGASGYVLKQTRPRDLLDAIRTVHEKGVYLNEMVSGKLLRTVSTVQPEIQFTERELEFLKRCCSEDTYREIADLMYVSPRTVDNYRESLFQKLQLKSRSGLVLYAVKNGIFKLDGAK